MKTKEKHRIFNVVFKLILVFVFCLGVLLLAALSPVFGIKAIDVYGNVIYEKQTIIDMTDAAIGENGFRLLAENAKSLFTFRCYALEKELAGKCPYIKEATVKFFPPDRLKIEISERKPMCVVPYLGINLLVDAEWHILDTVNASEYQDLPVVNGIKVKQYELGQALEAENPESLSRAARMLDALKNADGPDEDFMRKVDSIDVGDADNAYVFYEARVAANFGDLRELEYRVKVLKHVLLKNFEKEDRGLLDFTAGKDPVFMPEK